VKNAFVYLKHDEGDAPSVAARLIEKLALGETRSARP
jgi:hypothetical protein